jgi:hypothetical protein
MGTMSKRVHMLHHDKILTTLKMITSQALKMIENMLNIR